MKNKYELSAMRNDSNLKSVSSVCYNWFCKRWKQREHPENKIIISVYIYNLLTNFRHNIFILHIIFIFTNKTITILYTQH